MKLQIVLSGTVAYWLASSAALAQVSPGASSPRLERRGAATQLVVDGKPFLVLGGELNNSSASSVMHMRSQWPALARRNFNTILATVSWELVEPDEGKFDFSVVDGLIQDARKSDLKLVFLWFASWKNGESTYMPMWVKRDTKRFPLAEDKSGRKLPILSSSATRRAPPTPGPSRH